ncbi:MAG: hypothetical protein ACO35C_04890 [Pontimonas sp.]
MQAATLVLTNRFLRSVVIYHMVLFAIFMVLYTSVIRFEEHFDLRYGTEATTSTIAYYTLHTQSTVMTGDIQPRTRLARALQSSHVLLSWFIVVLAMTPLNE